MRSSPLAGCASWRPTWPRRNVSSSRPQVAAQKYDQKRQERNGLRYRAIATGHQATDDAIAMARTLLDASSAILNP